MRIVIKRFQHILAMEFAIKEINENPNFLSNISLGFYNIHSYPMRGVTYKATLNLLSAHQKLVPNFSCATQKKLIVIIGGLISEISANIATILNIYKTPQVPLYSLPLPEKVWITTSHWDFESSSIQRLWDIQSFHGALSFAIHSNQPPGFQEFLQTIRPSWDGKDGFVQDFWEQAFSCSLKVLNEEEENKQRCTGKEKLETLPGVLFEMGMTGHSYNIYNAVYSVAHVLNDIHLLKSKHRKLVGGRRLDFQNVQSSEVVLCF
ncbi:UNVERIFIED_CONTAM: hypothetical protein K2H54_033760 [Gekko kuhli]